MIDKPALSNGRYVQLPQNVLAARGVTVPAKVLWALARDLQGGNGESWHGVRSLARKLGCSPGLVVRAVGELVHAGWLKKTPGRLTGTRRERSNHYTVIDPPPVPDNVSEMATLSNRERSRNRHVNVSKSDTSTYPKRAQNEPNKQAPRMNPNRKAPSTLRDCWTEAQAVMTGSSLKTTAFQTAWLEWADYRRQSRKALTAATMRKQIKQLESWGPEVAVASIEQSIRNGWQGLFAPKFDGKAQQPILGEQISVRIFGN